MRGIKKFKRFDNKKSEKKPKIKSLLYVTVCFIKKCFENHEAKTTVKKITKTIKEKNIYCLSGFPFRILNERSSSSGSQQLIFFLVSRN